MVNTIKILQPLIHMVVKLAGLTPKLVEIQPGTLLNIWVPKRKTDKPVVVFLHSFAATGILTWVFQAISLSGTYSVYVPDFIFFGDSFTEKSDRTSAFQAECVAKGLRKLGVEKCTIVGLSYGGMVGFKLAKNYPDLVELMVVSGTVMELTESFTAAAAAKLGVGGWSELLMPKTVDGLMNMMTVGTHVLPGWLPKFVYKHYLEEDMKETRMKREGFEEIKKSSVAAQGLESSSGAQSIPTVQFKALSLTVKALRKSAVQVKALSMRVRALSLAGITILKTFFLYFNYLFIPCKAFKKPIQVYIYIYIYRGQLGFIVESHIVERRRAREAIKNTRLKGFI